MPSCVLYARVSSDRQTGNTSIADQLALLRAWAVRHGYAVAAEFVDDGESARVRDALTESFDSRPGWRQLRVYLKGNPAGRGGPSAVVFKDYKRFSRDVAAAHATIRELRHAGVEVQAAEQPIDWAVPEQKLLVGIYLADGEVDNDRRSAAVRRGMAARVREGRYTFRPPLGYRATYDGRRRLGIEPDPETAPAVAAAFEMAANPDRPLSEARAALARAVGPRDALTSPSAFKTLLQCRTYVGDIPVPVAARDELGAWLPGTHAPITPAAVWQAVQDRLTGRPAHAPRGRQRPVRPELYLRGLVRSRSGVVLTGSGVRSRHGYRVWYYHGQGKGAERVAAEAVHTGVADWLAAHAPTAGMLDLVRACVAEELAHAGGEREALRRRAERDAQTAARRLERATEALVDGHIDPDAYGPLAARYRAERDAALAQLDGGPPEAAPGDVLDRALSFVADVAGLYEAGTPSERREIVGSIMPAGIAVGPGRVIEPLPSPLLALLFGLDGTEKAGTTNGRPGEDGRFGAWLPD